MRSKVYLSILITFICVSNTFGQFTPSGDAFSPTCNCFQLTDDVADELGSFNKNATINLNDPHQLKFSVNFGCEPTGGEGLAFLLKGGAWTVGTGGFGLGYDGIAGNVLAVEFDTRDNDASGEIVNFDISGDHISLQDNGDSDHEDSNPNNLLGIPSGLNAGEDPTPHNIKPGFPNLEDCEDHLIEINWTPGVNQTIEIIVDGIVSLTYIGDMITSQFGGNPVVRWGWTGSTGVGTNIQTVCLALNSNFTYSPTVCPGEEIDFTNTSVSFLEITDWSWDFDGLGSSILENPSFTFDEAGIYEVTLTVTDDGGCTNSTVIEIPIGFDTEVTADDTDICPDATTVLHVEGLPYIDTECCFKLVMNDLWGDFWGSGVANELEVTADGAFFGSYTPTSFDPGSGTSDTVELCFEQGTELEFTIIGDDSPAECSYYFYTEDLTELIHVDGIVPGTWIDGGTESYTVDCGLVPVDYEFLWDNITFLDDENLADPTATVPSTTWFHVDITDIGSGCTITDSILITTNPPVNAVISGLDSICEGETGELTIEFTGPGPYDITVFGPSGPMPEITGILSSPYTLTVDEDGDYSLIGVFGDGCDGTFSGSGTLEVIVPFSVEIRGGSVYCEGDAISDAFVTTTGGGEVNWYDNPALLPPVLETGYTFSPPSIIGTNTYYCAETEPLLGCIGPAAELTITVNPIPPAPTYAGLTVFCEGDELELFAEASLGGTINWYDDDLPGGTLLGTGLSFTTLFTPPGGDIYITEIAEDCESPTTRVEITVNETPDPPLVTGTLEYCEGDIASALTGIPGLGGTIIWRNELGVDLATGINFTPTLVPGSTNIYVYEKLGDCESEATIVTIITSAKPEINLPVDQIICLGDSIQIIAITNDYDVRWSNGLIGDTVWVKPTVTTQYIAKAISPICGNAEDTIIVNVKNFSEIQSSNDTVIGIGGEANIWSRSEGNVTYSWSPDIYECLLDDCSSVLVIPDRPTVYFVTAVDENGCSTTDTILVDISGVMQIFVPNLFSPNGDGHNDYLEIFGPRLFNYSIEIYDRWGKLIFKSNNQEDYWDGKFNGKDLPAQTFVYMISGQTIMKEDFVKEGNVTIVK
ncbi:lectin-like domain-containing protein [Crocinitomix catalasitica]|uniref:lectin-like domain-containing protein n=1 Tax=Crocinitomix catalasitica TaxID=184607 RepID=UPI0009FD9B21|nr:gliding motility-associated C-terminal domain-containing protein [Crocinitomix catalasitica]